MRVKDPRNYLPPFSGPKLSPAKKKIPLEVVRNYPHLRTKTNYFSALFRLRHTISKAIHDFFHQEGFYYVPTPIITSSDAEGAGETFNLTTSNKEPFFSKSAKLTVSGQLQAEALVQGLGKVYTFGPCFRAEKSHTTRHLAEFWMIEAELVPTGLETVIKLAERLVKFVINSVLIECFEELEYFEKYQQIQSIENTSTVKDQIIHKLVAIIEKDFIRLDYTQAIKVLIKSSQKFTFDSVF